MKIGHGKTKNENFFLLLSFHKADKDMKRYYYITIIAIVATIGLQASYISSLYRQYIADTEIGIEKEIQKIIEEERLIRTHRRNGGDDSQPKLITKALEDMTSQELDSIRKLPHNADTIDIDNAQKTGIGMTVGELIIQLSQDNLMRAGFPLNPVTLDSLWSAEVDLACLHLFRLCDKDTLPISSAGNLKGHAPNYSRFYPIGTKGLQYLRVEVFIPMSSFLVHQIWTLVLSACMMLLVLLCLFYQLTTIRRKEVLLRKREMTINGTVHDLKAPLNSIITLLGWMKSMTADEAVRDVMETGRAGVKRLIGNIEALLMTARTDYHRIVLNRAQVDVPQMAEEVKEEMDRLYENKLHTLCVINELPDGFAVEADRMYLENVMRNLMENALKYADAGVKVEVRLSAEGDGLRVEVKDNGWGIEPCYRKKLFTQFYQVPRNKEQQQKGYGIGLAQAKCIVKEHGGNIGMESHEGQGSTFFFTIPCNPENKCAAWKR